MTTYETILLRDLTSPTPLCGTAGAPRDAGDAAEVPFGLEEDDAPPTAATEL
jgi:hypothetical protein